MPSDWVSHYEHGRGKRANVAITSEFLLRSARGFSCIFWGLPLALLLFSGAIDIRVFPQFRVPVYVFGVFLIYCGVMLLMRTAQVTEAWTRRIRETLVVLLLQVYLAPFVYWWRKMPHMPYYVVNILALLLCAAWGLYLLNMLGGEIGRILHDRVFHTEARVSAWTAVVFMSIPVVHAVLQSVKATFQFETLVQIRVPPDLLTLPRWVAALALLPFTLTMAVVWKAKERCLTALKRSAALPGASAPPPPPEPA